MRRLVSVLVLPALLLGVLAPAAAAATSPRVLERAAHQRVLDYWTPARMAAATERVAWAPLPRAKPGTGSGGGTTTTVTGASWTGGGDVATITGKVWFTLGGSNYICTGTIVADNVSNSSVVVTAGHCIAENDGTMATNFIFIPNFDANPTYTCANTLYGCWTADRLYADSEFVNAGGFNDTAVTHDWGFARMRAGGKSGGQVDALGAAGLGTGLARGDTVSSFGYPAAQKYTGSDLVYCRGTVGEDRYTNNATWSLPCTMTGGSSGGPWLAGDPLDDASSTVVSVNSYGYSGVKYMFGPKFNQETLDAFEAARNARTSATGISISGSIGG